MSISLLRSPFNRNEAKIPYGKMNIHRYPQEEMAMMNIRKALSLTSNLRNVMNTKCHSHPMYWQRFFKVLMGSFIEMWMGPESAIKGEVTGSSTLF